MKDDELITLALQLYANLIETGNPHLSGADMAAQKKPVKPLEEEGVTRVLRLRQLANNVGEHDTDKILAQFHKLWGQCHDGVYEKPEWGELHCLLERELKGVKV